MAQQLTASVNKISSSMLELQDMAATISSGASAASVASASAGGSDRLLESIQESKADVQRRILQGVEEIKTRCLPSLCAMLPLTKDKKGFFQKVMSEVGVETFTVHFMCEYSPTHHCTTLSEQQTACFQHDMLGSHYTNHPGYQIKKAKKETLDKIKTFMTVLTVLQYSAKLMNVLGACHLLMFSPFFCSAFAPCFVRLIFVFIQQAFTWTV